MKELIIDTRGGLVRGAAVEDGELMELIIEDGGSSAGNIFVGTVKNILPSQFAFVDIGEDKNAFLHLNDIKEAGLYDGERLKIKQGSSLIVQVIKDATGEKGANITSQLSFTGKRIVLLRNSFGKKEIGISKKISSSGERERLKTIAQKMADEKYGIIMRTESENADAEDIYAEFNELKNICEDILKRGQYIKPPAALYKEESAAVKITKELLTKDIESVTMNSASDFSDVKILLDKYNAAEKISLKCCDEGEAVFDEHRLEGQISKALNKKVWLKSGGFLYVEQTEACVVIDVNTGKYAGKKSHEQTIFKLNTEAAAEVAKQIQVRNLSGIIIIDFIDMKDSAAVKELVKTMEAQLARMRIGATIVGMTSLGLMQITRKKIREPISHILLEDCKCCGGRGKVFRHRGGN